MDRWMRHGSQGWVLSFEQQQPARMPLTRMQLKTPGGSILNVLDAATSMSFKTPFLKVRRAGQPVAAGSGSAELLLLHFT